MDHQVEITRGAAFKLEFVNPSSFLEDEAFAALFIADQSVAFFQARFQAEIGGSHSLQLGIEMVSIEDAEPEEADNLANYCMICQRAADWSKSPSSFTVEAVVAVARFRTSVFDPANRKKALRGCEQLRTLLSETITEAVQSFGSEFEAGTAQRLSEQLLTADEMLAASANFQVDMGE